VERYDRSDVLRILRITARQLAGWEKAGLLSATDSYSFFDLLQIKKLRDLRAKRVRSAVILESLRAMRQVAGMENPMMEMGTFASQSRVVFRHQGSAVEPLAGQFVMVSTAVACLIAGVGLLNVAEAQWAHAVGVASLFGFIVIGFLALVPGTPGDEETLTRPGPHEGGQATGPGS